MLRRNQELCKTWPEVTDEEIQNWWFKRRERASYTLWIKAHKSPKSAAQKAWERSNHA